MGSNSSRGPAVSTINEPSSSVAHFWGLPSNMMFMLSSANLIANDKNLDELLTTEWYSRRIPKVYLLLFQSSFCGSWTEFRMTSETGIECTWFIKGFGTLRVAKRLSSFSLLKSCISTLLTQFLIRYGSLREAGVVRSFLNFFIFPLAANTTSSARDKHLRCASRSKPCVQLTHARVWTGCRLGRASWKKSTWFDYLNVNLTIKYTLRIRSYSVC